MSEPALPRALVVDDELSICKACEKILQRAGFQVASALSGKAALELLAQEPFDLVFTDLKMVEMGGMELLEALRARFPDIVPVVITGYATVASVVETMKLGAFDYLPKPFTPDEMVAVARHAWEKRQLLLARRGAAQSSVSAGLGGLVGRSERMREVLALIRKVAATSSNVLIVGESGTGKELVARAVHAESPRREERFFAVDCGTLTASLLESELFGHLRGAFTGALANKRGIFEVAHGGTVLLDEISNVGLDVQAKLLRFVQEREFLPVGGTEPRRVDVRLIFATNRDLAAMVQDGTFREDLYYRLNVFPVYVPPLRERAEDIPLLAYYLLGRIRARSGTRVATISDGAVRLLQRYEWPGNVRQLESAIEWAAINCEGDTIEPRHLPKAVLRLASAEEASVPVTNAELLARKRELRETAVAQLEREFVLAALERNGWNVTQAAVQVGIKRQNFQGLMRKHGLRADQPGSRETRDVSRAPAGDADA
jgi:DNA-binding NtrC family response regulator